MPVPIMQPMTNFVDCIHNATKGKNQDEISFPGGKPGPSVEKFCRKIPRCVRGKGCAPAASRPRKRLLFYSRGNRWSKGSWKNFLFPPAFP